MKCSEISNDLEIFDRFFLILIAFYLLPPEYTYEWTLSKRILGEFDKAVGELNIDSILGNCAAI